jgi:hypothetical protein
LYANDLYFLYFPIVDHYSYLLNARANITVIITKLIIMRFLFDSKYKILNAITTD